MSKIEATKPVGYDDINNAKAEDVKKIKEEKMNSLFADKGAVQQVAFTLDVGNSIFNQGSTQSTQTAVQA